MEKTNSTQPSGRPLDPRSEPLLLRPAEAARFLAISPRKLWELTNCREVPAIRIGRALRYPDGGAPELGGGTPWPLILTVPSRRS